MGKEKSADATWRGGMRFDVRTQSGHTVTLDTTEVDGGGDAGPSPMDLLVVALAGCTGMDVISILTKMRQQVTGLRIAVHGVRVDEHPQVFQTITVDYTVTGHGLSHESVARAIELSETKYCSVSATLRSTAQITTSFHIEEG